MNRQIWVNKYTSNCNPFQYDLCGKVFLEQTHNSLIQVLVFLDGNNFVVIMPGIHSTPCAQDIQDFFFKEISLQRGLQTLNGVQLYKNEQKINFYFIKELQRALFIEKLSKICSMENIYQIYEFERELTANVHEATHRSNGRKVAVKFYSGSDYDI